MPLHQITPEDELLRRIILQPQFFKITPDGVRRPTSAAFKMRSGEDGLSVDILGLTTLELAIANRSTHTGAVLSAKVPLDNRCPCVHDPIAGNQAHALIKNVTPALAKLFAVNAVLL